MTSHNRQQKNVIKRSSLNLPHVVEEKQDNAIIIEDWLAERLTDKLRKASIVVQQTHRPHLLYRIPSKRVRMFYRKKWALYPENT